mmetsp:Transcript_10012/g.14441  ORF Transcript_10012/g.14441 Transcript_10012/m.14441 type:complete len:159 (-) Transcript_10012:149-625(-)
MMQVLPLPWISATIQTQKKNLCLDYYHTYDESDSDDESDFDNEYDTDSESEGDDDDDSDSEEEEAYETIVGDKNPTGRPKGSTSANTWNEKLQDWQNYNSVPNLHILLLFQFYNRYVMQIIVKINRKSISISISFSPLNSSMYKFLLLFVPSKRVFII